MTTMLGPHVSTLYCIKRQDGVVSRTHMTTVSAKYCALKLYLLHWSAAGAMQHLVIFSQMVCVSFRFFSRT